jgi:hypothetical protein
MTQAPSKPYDWSVRYGPDWTAIGKRTKQLQSVRTEDGEFVRCAWCGNLFDWEETQAHHVRYAIEGSWIETGEALGDSAKPLEDVFAVCGRADKPGTCHHALHQDPMWIEDKNNRVLGDHNDPQVIFQLKQNTRQHVGTETTEEPPMTSSNQTTSNRQQWRDRFQKHGSNVRAAYEDSWALRAASWVLLSGLIAALTYVSWLNIGPYVQLVKMLGDDSPNWLQDLPLIGAIVNAWSSLIMTIVGILVWAMIQTLQILWLLVSLDRRALTGAVSNAQTSRFQITGNADRPARQIAKKANKIPYFFIRWAGLFSLGAYAFDAAIGLSLYPPARSIGDFFFALSAGLWSRIDGKNLTKLILMLFAFEIALILFIVVWQWVKTRRSTATN